MEGSSAASVCKDASGTVCLAWGRRPRYRLVVTVLVIAGGALIAAWGAILVTNVRGLGRRIIGLMFRYAEAYQRRNMERNPEVYRVVFGMGGRGCGFPVG